VQKILEKWGRDIKQGKFLPRCRDIKFKYFVEEDRGMYDALNKGFAKTSGEVLAWINSDDMYHPYAFSTAARIFEAYPDVAWITGIPNSYNFYGGRAGCDIFPPAYSREFLRRGYYDVKFRKYGFNWIQQESTFWRRSLYEAAGGKIDDRFKYAADFYLWQEFAKHADLVKVASFLGGYRFHGDQVTGEPHAYREELPDTGKPPAGLLVLKSIMRNFPYTKKLFYNRAKGFPLINLLGLEWDWLRGRVIEWSYPDKKWKIRSTPVL
jgi:glycosyltransferase involved in cell wall biosynthesis